jgi:hypothetical protein
LRFCINACIASRASGDTSRLPKVVALNSSCAAQLRIEWRAHQLLGQDALQLPAALHHSCRLLAGMLQIVVIRKHGIGNTKLAGTAGINGLAEHQQLGSTLMTDQQGNR